MMEVAEHFVSLHDHLLAKLLLHHVNVAIPYVTPQSQDVLMHQISNNLLLRGITQDDNVEVFQDDNLHVLFALLHELPWWDMEWNLIYQNNIIILFLLC
jgi:hypothetical protein